MSAPEDASLDEVVAAHTGAVDWQRVHLATPLLKLWKVLTAITGALILNPDFISLNDTLRMLRDLGERQKELDVAATVLAALPIIFAAIIAALAYLSWRAEAFAITDDAVLHREGVLTKKSRQARLDRLQAVDVVRPLIARLTGFSALTLEVAGGGDSKVQIAYLRVARAEELRREILRRASGAKAAIAATDANPAEDGAPASARSAGRGLDALAQQASVALSEAAATFVQGVDDEDVREVYRVPTKRLILGSLLSASTVVPILVVVVVGVSLVVAAVKSDSSAEFELGTVMGAAAAPIFAVVGAALAAFNRFNRSMMFRAGVGQEGIRLQHGLTETRRQTIPPGRIQAVRVVRPVLWQWNDWWKVDINVAGYGKTASTSADASDNQLQETMLLPIGTRADAFTALRLVLPELPDVAGDDALATFMADVAGQATFHSPQLPWWFEPLAWRRRAVWVTERAVLIRSGWWKRELVVVPHERVQSMAVTQGPLQRRLGISSVRLHSTVGAIKPIASHLRTADAAEYVEDQARRSRAARAKVTTDQWLAEVVG